VKETCSGSEQCTASRVSAWMRAGTLECTLAWLIITRCSSHSLQLHTSLNVRVKQHHRYQVISSQTTGEHAGILLGGHYAAAVPQKPAAAVRGPGASSVSIWRRCCCWSATVATCCAGCTTASHAASSTARHGWCSSVNICFPALQSPAAAGDDAGSWLGIAGL
jgi:hypothetical protein